MEYKNFLNASKSGSSFIIPNVQNFFLGRWNRYLHQNYADTKNGPFKKIQLDVKDSKLDLNLSVFFLMHCKNSRFILEILEVAYFRNFQCISEILGAFQKFLAHFRRTRCNSEIFGAFLNSGYILGVLLVFQKSSVHFRNSWYTSEILGRFQKT